jgi:hypothetical protein
MVAPLGLTFSFREDGAFSEAAIRFGGIMKVSQHLVKFWSDMESIILTRTRSRTAGTAKST